MNTKKKLLSWITGFVVMFVLGFLWHQIIMGDFYDNQMSQVLRVELRIPFVILGYIVLAFLMAYVYPMGYQGGSPLKEGLRFGVLIGLIWVLPHGLVALGTENITVAGGLVDAIWHVVEQGIGGVVIGLVYGSGAEPATG